MYGDVLHEGLFLRAVFLVDFEGFQFRQGDQAFVANELAKDGVEAVQVRRFIEKDKELRPVCSGALVGHGDDAAGVVLQSRPDLILEGAAPYALAALGVLGRRICRSACLDHEVGDETVEGRVVIIPGCAESQEILRRRVSDDTHEGPHHLRFSVTYLGRFGNTFTENLNLEVAKVCVQRDRHGGEHRKVPGRFLGAAMW